MSGARSPWAVMGGSTTAGASLMPKEHGKTRGPGRDWEQECIMKLPRGQDEITKSHKSYRNHAKETGIVNLAPTLLNVSLPLPVSLILICIKGCFIL